MATDGVKIIDGDLAHDIYWGIMDMYDKGVDISTIKREMPFIRRDYGIDEDFYHEIFVTAYALAMWEIGALTDGVLRQVRKVIDEGAGVRMWTAIEDAKAGKQRQRELDKLWVKINSKNKKVRKVKKYKTVTNFLFEPNDVLTFQLTDKYYYVTILFKIDQYRGDCNYEFGKVLYKDSKMPAIEDVLNAEVIGRKIPSGHGMDLTSIFSMKIEEILKQGGIDELLKREADKTGSFVIGLAQTAVEHKDLMKFADKFQKIGQIKIKEAYKETGSFGGASDFDDLTREFPDLENYIRIFNADKFKIADLLEQ